MSEFRVTHIGTATMLLEVGSVRLLTDPCFDKAGKRYTFGLGTSGRKLQDPAGEIDSLGDIDAILLSHDQHGDNLDKSGRTVLQRTREVLTTVAGARRLGGNAVGLRPWQERIIKPRDGESIRVTATPARHGPLIIKPIVGDVIGFLLEWPSQEHGNLYISGDTVFFGGLAEVPARSNVSVAVLHLGAVSFGITGPIRYTMNDREAVRLVKLLDPKTVIPIHYEGWTHFRQPRAVYERAFEEANVADRTLWLRYGEATTLGI